MVTMNYRKILYLIISLLIIGCNCRDYDCSPDVYLREAIIGKWKRISGPSDIGNLVEYTVNGVRDSSWQDPNGVIESEQTDYFISNGSLCLRRGKNTIHYGKISIKDDILHISRDVLSEDYKRINK